MKLWLSAYPFADLYPSQLVAGLNSSDNSTGAGLQDILDGFWQAFAAIHTNYAVAVNASTSSSTPRTLYVRLGVSGFLSEFDKNKRNTTILGHFNGAFVTTPLEAVNFGTMVGPSVLSDGGTGSHNKMQLYALAADAGSQTRRWKQPSVLAYCAMPISAEQLSTFGFIVGDGWPDSGSVEATYVNTTTPTAGGGVAFIDPSTLRFDHPISISAAISLWPSPAIYQSGNSTTIATANASSLCLLSAQWREADVYIALDNGSSPSYPPSVMFDLPLPSLPMIHDIGEPIITMQPDWLHPWVFRQSPQHVLHW